MHYCILIHIELFDILHECYSSNQLLCNQRISHCRFLLIDLHLELDNPSDLYLLVNTCSLYILIEYIFHQNFGFEFFRNSQIITYLKEYLL